MGLIEEKTPPDEEMETTAEERAEIKRSFAWPVDTTTKWNRYIRDFDRLSAEIVRLNAALAEERAGREQLWQHLNTERDQAGAREAAAREEMRDKCLQRVAEQRCERDTPWDRALVTAMAAIRSQP